MATIFKTVPWKVESLVSEVSSGAIQLPDLQRPFVWPAAKVRDLLDSMYKGYPVGELMFWDLADEQATHSIAADAKLGAKYQVIDGQQRLTSLYAATQGKTVRDEDYRVKSIAISFNPFTEKFEVRSPALAKSPQWIADISTVFQAPFKAKKAFLARLREADQDLSEDQDERIDEVFTRLADLAKYSFDVIHVQGDVEKRTVADIFVRINSEGVRLKASDYILTWLSVFWPEGRESIEEFARNSRVTPERASEVAGRHVAWTAKNPFIAVETAHVVRALVAIGQERGRLQDAYSALQAKDRQTGLVDADKQERELNLLKQALPVVVDRISWTEYIHAIQTAGFRSHRNITSSLNIVYTYVIFLLGRHRFTVDLPRLRPLIARWLFMAQLTGRYTGSSESQIQKDLDLVSLVSQGNAAGFESALNEVIASQLTPDYWRYSMPQDMISSGSAISPHYQCYLAALNILDADMFMLRSKVHDWMDPGLPTIKGMEGHHLFPRAYQTQVLGITDMKRVNQVANFAPTDWDTNIFISDRSPAEYWPQLVAERGGDPDWLKKQLYWHALPDGWEGMEYEEFLGQRRALMAQVTKDAFEKLSVGVAMTPTDAIILEDQVLTKSLQELIEAGYLKPGDLLDPVDPDWVVDAVITDDGTVRIDGNLDFDSLDEAARHLGVTNISGFEFWALESGGGLVPLSELVGAIASAA